MSDAEPNASAEQAAEDTDNPSGAEGSGQDNNDGDVQEETQTKKDPDDEELKEENETLEEGEEHGDNTEELEEKAASAEGEDHDGLGNGEVKVEFEGVPIVDEASEIVTGQAGENTGSKVSTSVATNINTPKNSRISYDGRHHYSHQEAPGTELNDMLSKLARTEETETHEDKPVDTAGAQPGPTKTYAFRARDYDEKKIMAMLQKNPPKHEYCGLLFSSECPRPFGLQNYFLPSIPQPSARKHIAVIGSQIPADVIHHSMHAAPHGLMPLSTVHIKWRLSPKYTTYDMCALYAYLTRFGAIEAVYKRSPNSALVVFCHIDSARRCVRCPTLGMPWDVLIATFWEPKMGNQGYAAKQMRQEEQNSLLRFMRPNVKDEVPPSASKV